MNDNTGQLELSNLGTTSSDEINSAMEGQPETVKPETENRNPCLWLRKLSLAPRVALFRPARGRAPRGAVG